MQLTWADTSNVAKHHNAHNNIHELALLLDVIRWLESVHFVTLRSKHLVFCSASHDQTE